MPELTESVESINGQLISLFGIDTISGDPMWRVVWSENQFEKRLMDTTDEGFHLLTPEVREVPKYRQWIKERYVLERLTIVPEINAQDLPSQKVTYEPMWVFETQHGVYLPPKLEAAKLVIDTVYTATGKMVAGLAKYKDPDSNQENALNNKKERIDGLVNDLFGDESALMGKTMSGEAVGFTTSNIKES